MVFYEAGKESAAQNDRATMANIIKRVWLIIKFAKKIYRAEYRRT